MTDTTKTSSLNENILALAAKIEQQLELDAKTGIGSAKADVYHDNLPENLTKEVVKDVHDYNSNFVAASTYAFGKMAVKAMEGNKDLESANIEIKMVGRDKVAVNTERKAEFSIGKEIVKYGQTTVAYTVQGGRNAGQLKAARDAVSALAAEALK